MKKLLLASAAMSLVAAGAMAEGEVKLGLLLGYTGPLETLAPPMAAAAELAAAEVNESGNFLDGTTVTTVRADDTCIDGSAAQAAAERLVTADGVSALVGAMCSGVTGVVLQNVARPNGIGMISPSATSPALSTVESDGLFFRTSPSDARQGQILVDMMRDRGYDTIAITYTNNDYGKGLADSIEEAFTASGGTVTIDAPHEDGKADYSAEVAALAAAGGQVLVVAGYIDQGGRGIIQGALDTGAFDTFVLPDGMYGESIIDNIGDAMNGSFGDAPGSDSNGADIFAEMSAAAGFDGTAAFSGQTYDAAAMILLAMQAAGSTDPKAWTEHVMDIANAPGEPILPGELGKALELISQGVDIDYVGATAVELIPPGEVAGNFREFEIQDGKIVTIGFR
ncbi:MAG: ABC transporter substrate-binding protein [Rubellimicrobium sp.]|nr:ABC transporter substrate-binding protein [Rubellimicrobium sp.]